MTEKVKSLKGQKFIGATQLADEAARLVGELVPRQERGSVSEVPDERMVRYYSAEGLISPPEGKQGSSAVYGYNHLLELLVIKRLQADHLPIRKIKELVDGKSERELEQLLDIERTEERAAEAKNPATEYLESLLKTSSFKAAAPMPAAPAVISPQAGSREPATAWTRIEIETGLELHVRNDYRLPDDPKDEHRLARRILNFIKNHGQQPGK